MVARYNPFGRALDGLLNLCRASLPPGLLIVAGILASSPLAAQERDLFLDRFRQEVTVRGDGTLDVEEHLTFRFEGSWNGIERDLMNAHRTAEGRRGRLRYRIDTVTGEDGRALEVESSSITGGTRLRIWVPGAEDAVRTVVIRYRVEGAIRFWTDELLARGAGGSASRTTAFDELYWNATGHGWEMEIGEAEVEVRLPGGATGVEAWGYTGYEGSTEQEVQVVAGEEGAVVRTTRSLEPYQGLTVSVAWDPGVVQRPTAADRAVRRVVGYWPAGLPPLALLGMFGVWRRRGRDPERRAIMVQYSPPEGLSPAEVGTLVDHRAEMHDITATLVDLAVRGYLHLEEVPKKGLLSKLSKPDYQFHQKRPRGEWIQLLPHERRYLGGLFPHTVVRQFTQAEVDVSGLMGAALKSWRESMSGGERFSMQRFARQWVAERTPPPADPGGGEEPMASVRLSELTNRFYSHIPGITEAIYDELKAKGAYTSRPDRVKGKWAGASFALLVLGPLGAGVTAGADVAFLPNPLVLGLGVALSGIIVMIFSRFMGVRTEAGVRMLEHALGFREFVQRVETPQYKRMITSPELFEKYLPYAMALKAEDRWAGAFEQLYRQPPDWYSGSSTAGFRATTFTRQMRAMSTEAGRTMSSSPSSSGSGSGGGGSSGGGSGGGGGRGF